MTITQIKEKLIEQIALSVGQEPSTITSDMMLHEIGMDSLKLIELFVFIEKEFKVQVMESGISQEAIMKIESLAQSIHTIITTNEIF